jgi:hypothetical protein
MTRTPDPELGVPHLDSRSRWTDIFCIAAYCYCFLVFGLQVNLLGPTARELAASLQVVEADLGVIFTLNGFISIIGAVPAGWAVDKLPGHVVLTVSLAAEVRVLQGSAMPTGHTGVCSSSAYEVHTGHSMLPTIAVVV